MKDDKAIDPYTNKSKWWFLLPIFLGVIGGVIAYFALRDDIGKAARSHLYLGVALTAAHIVLGMFGVFNVIDIPH